MEREVDVNKQKPWQHEPGSPYARVLGCTCDPEKNNDGKGVMQADGPHWYPDWRCPVHGIQALRKGPPELSS